MEAERITNSCSHSSYKWILDGWKYWMVDSSGWMVGSSGWIVDLPASAAQLQWSE